MSKVFQSPGGSDSPASESQAVPASPSDGLHARLRLSVAGACDIASLGGEIQALGRHLHANDGNATALVVEVLAARVSLLANAVCSALDDEGGDVAELERIVYDGREVRDFRPPAAAAMVAAVLAEGARAQGGAA